MYNKENNDIRKKHIHHGQEEIYSQNVKDILPSFKKDTRYTYPKQHKKAKEKNDVETMNKVGVCVDSNEKQNHSISRKECDVFFKDIQIIHTLSCKEVTSCSLLPLRHPDQQ